MHRLSILLCSQGLATQYFDVFLFYMREDNVIKIIWELWLHPQEIYKQNMDRFLVYLHQVFFIMMVFGVTCHWLEKSFTYKIPWRATRKI